MKERSRMTSFFIFVYVILYFCLRFKLQSQVTSKRKPYDHAEIYKLSAIANRMVLIAEGTVVTLQYSELALESSQYELALTYFCS